MYPDVLNYNTKITLKDAAYAHWIKYGMKENRVCNYESMLSNYSKNYNDSIQQINDFNCNPLLDENKLNILIRTHLREEKFVKSINSILFQNYTNYHIYISYDDGECLTYLDKYVNHPKITIIHVKKTSNNECFFDLYNNELMKLVNDGYILFLDDDKYFIHSNSFQIINNFLGENTLLIWKLLQADKFIYPSDIKDIKYGEIDTCIFCFNSLHKNKSFWGDNYGSDFYFFNNLQNTNELKLLLIDFAFVSVYDLSYINNFGEYLLKEDISMYQNKFIDSKRIDYTDYISHYDDLKIAIKNNKEGENHWLNYGRFESRIVKFLDFNYELFLKNIQNFQYYDNVSMCNVHIITSLYNEINIQRQQEYEISLNHNLKNPYIIHITIFYDVSKGVNTIFLDKYSTNKKINIIFIDVRPTFYDFFYYANNSQTDNIIYAISNADIIFDDTIKNTNKIKTNNVIALTRWDFIDENVSIPRIKFNKIFHDSKDVWLFKSKLNLTNMDNLKSIHIGDWNCDGNIKQIIKNSNSIYIEDCLNIRSYHVHFCNGRTYKDK